MVKTPVYKCLKYRAYYATVGFDTAAAANPRRQRGRGWGNPLPARITPVWLTYRVLSEVSRGDLHTRMAGLWYDTPHVEALTFPVDIPEKPLLGRNRIIEMLPGESVWQVDFLVTKLMSC